MNVRMDGTTRIACAREVDGALSAHEEVAQAYVQQKRDPRLAKGPDATIPQIDEEAVH